MQNPEKHVTDCERCDGRGYFYRNEDDPESPSVECDECSGDGVELGFYVAGQGVVSADHAKEAHQQAEAFMDCKVEDCSWCQEALADRSRIAGVEWELEAECDGLWLIGRWRGGRARERVRGSGLDDLLEAAAEVTNECLRCLPLPEVA